MTDLWRLSAAEVTRRIAAREISACEVTEASLQRLQQVNPKINAIVQTLPETALDDAATIDRAIAAGEPAGLLCGVPVTVKVNIDQAGCANTNGLRIQRDLVPTLDSPVVSNLRRAGAIIIGRSNTPAFSMRWFTRNSLHGHTRNPRNATLTPGGSSGGGAAAVAAGACAISHGTDIAGSIRYPAYACGLHGIRPSFGRIPAVNLSLPDRHIGAQLTAVSGPMARRVKDLELSLAALAASNQLDPWWVPAPLAQPLPAKRAALCIAPDSLAVSDSVVAALSDAASQLQEAGWEIVEVDCPPMREPMRLQLLLWMSEYHYNGGSAVAREDDADANFVYAQLLENCTIPTLENLMEALQRRLTLAREWHQFLVEYPILLCPISAEPPFPDLLDVESPASFRRVLEAQMTQIALPLMGMPAMSVAVGKQDPNPMGVQLVAARFREDVLFSAASDIEARNPDLEVADPD